MTQDINTLVAELTALRLPELKSRYEQVLGKPTRCPNRTFLIRSICDAVREAEADAVAEPNTATNDDEPMEISDLGDADDTEDAQSDSNEQHATEPDEEAPDPDSAGSRPRRSRHPNPDRQPRGRFSGMSVEELQRMYAEVVGRQTGSTHRGYLSWKIREAEKGRIPIGPRRTRARQGEPADMKILPLRLEAEAVEAIDAAWRDRGMKTRMEFLRRALGHYLEHIGAEDAAARFGVASNLAQ